MPDSLANNRQLLLLEPDALLRRTVAITARTLDLGNVHEAASAASAERLLKEKVFDGAIMAVQLAGANAQQYDLALLDRVREGATSSGANLPIAVMAEQVNKELLASLLERDVSRVIIKPFRVRVLLEAIQALSEAAAPGGSEPA